MSAGQRQEFIRSHTFGLIRIMGLLIEEGSPLLFTEAKALANAMAWELNMPEALQDIQPLALEDMDEARQRFNVSVGHLAKACEALDHLEDFPYRSVIEKSIREILQL